MNPQLRISPERVLIGKRITTSLSENATFRLWNAFIPNLKDLSNRINNDLISVEIYNPDLPFSDFNSETKFEKWAAVEVSHPEQIPDTLEKLTIPRGLYAVFLYKGAASAAASAFNYIFTQWLPSSEFEVDKRPHFEVMGKNYKQEDPSSEEELWVPVTKKI